MNADLLRKAGIDYDGGVKRFMVRADFYEKVLSKFSADSTFERIRADYAANDNDQLLKDAHELKGMCGNMSLTTLYEAADALVSLLRRESFSPSELHEAFTQLELNYNVVSNAVRDATEADV